MPRNAAETKIPTLLVTWPIWPCPSRDPRRKPARRAAGAAHRRGEERGRDQEHERPSDSPSQIAPRRSGVSRMKNPATTIANAPMPTA